MSCELAKVGLDLTLTHKFTFDKDSDKTPPASDGQKSPCVPKPTDHCTSITASLDFAVISYGSGEEQDFTGSIETDGKTSHYTQYSFTPKVKAQALATPQLTANITASYSERLNNGDTEYVSKPGLSRRNPYAEGIIDGGVGIDYDFRKDDYGVDIPNFNPWHPSKIGLTYDHIYNLDASLIHPNDETKSTLTKNDNADMVLLTMTFKY